ncbi:MAG: putative bifunctional diguanylate cyclase/phosphodiesterase [Acetobacterium sp.]
MKPIRLTVPEVIRLMQEAAGDNDRIGYYENIMVMMYSSVLLLGAAIMSFVVRYFIQANNFQDSIRDSIIFFLLGTAFSIAIRINIKVKQVTLIISALSLVTLVFIAIAFYDIIGPAVWTGVFIMMSLALMRITKTMLYALEIGVLIAGVLVFFRALNSPGFDMNMTYYAVQSLLFLVLCIVFAAVHKIGTDRYFGMEKQFKDVLVKNEEISTLNKSIIKSEEKVKHLAFHDQLTGLPNRHFLADKLNNDIFAATNKDKISGILYLDLDDFKMINDTMGHDSGDQLLIQVAQRLVKAMDKIDTVARIGGDEFIILIQDCEEIATIDRASERILKYFKEPFTIDGQDCFVTTSLGFAVYPTDGKDAETLIKNADIAMYKAKEKGKNKYMRCSVEMKQNVDETMKITNGLYQALEKNEFELYYQPQVCSTTREIVGLEALIRWHHPDWGMVLPTKFIHIAEQTSIICAIGAWVLRTACAQNKAWQDAGFPKLRMGVNLSPREFYNDNLIDDVKNILAETGLGHDYLELEITESAAMNEQERVIETLNAFKAMGIHIAIDDFGTDYASFNYLKQLPIDRIKIPMTFVQGLDTSVKDEAITKAIIILAKNMGLKTIAEGVETKNQLDFLNSRMCDEIQGFYYYKPMPAHEIEKLLKDKTL